MSRRRVVAMVLAAMACVAVLTGGVAGASSSRGSTLALTVIKATRVDGGLSIDRKQLPNVPTDQKPFKGYNVFKLLHHDQFALAAGKPIAGGDASAAGYTLDDGSQLQVTLDGVVADAREPRYALHVQLGNRGSAPLLDLHVTVSAGEAFFVGGQNYQGGKLVLELQVL